MSFVSADVQDYLPLVTDIPGNAFALGSLIDLSEFEEISLERFSGDDSVLILFVVLNELPKKIEKSFYQYVGRFFKWRVDGGNELLQEINH